MASDQKEMQLMVRREMARRPIDSSLVEVHVTHGVVYLRGMVRPIRGSNTDLEQEMHTLIMILKQKQGVREVVNELRMV